MTQADTETENGVNGERSVRVDKINKYKGKEKVTLDFFSTSQTVGANRLYGN